MNCHTLSKPVFIALVAMIAAVVSVAGEARILRVIHTNDLHSHFDHATAPERGGYAAIKATMDRLRSEAAARGEETLVLDAGDFSEGSQYYLQGKGQGPFHIMNQMGYDAVVMGNHDWLMGPSHLDWLLPIANPTFAFLGANFAERPDRQFIGQYIKPYRIFERAGTRIAVLGLTTNDFFYSWRANEGDGSGVDDPIRVASSLLPRLRRHADVVIALTHLGYKKDVDLVQKNRGIDLVVGGHSHTCLYEPVWAQDKDKRMIPVVQTGNHGEYVGLTTLDVEPGRESILLNYEMIPIYSKGEKSEEVTAQIASVREKMENEYGRPFLNEIVAQSDVPLENPEGHATVWSRVFAEAIRHSAGTELSFDMPQFHGISQPAGPIRMEQLFELYPRMFDFEDHYGWNVWKAKLSGWLIISAIRVLAAAGVPSIVGGASVDVRYKSDGKPSIRSITIGGRPLNPFRNYTVAFGEGIVRASSEISPALNLIVKKPENTKKPVWLEVRRYIQEVLSGHITSESGKVDVQGKPTFLTRILGRAPTETREPAGIERKDPQTTCQEGPSGQRFLRSR